MMTTWRSELLRVIDWVDVVETTLTEEELDFEFDNDYGNVSGGCHFTLWTKDRVYFPVVYDGSLCVESVSRNPNGVATEYIGGY